ncbi:hypothetical protein ACP4OV_025455 [Aristida adscensionis]
MRSTTRLFLPSTSPRRSAVALVIAAAAAAVLAAAATGAAAQLNQSYYAATCPNVEALVRGAVVQKLQETFNAAPGTLRLFFHDCFVRGCDASVLLSGPDDEHSAGADTTLSPDALDLVTRAKAAVDGDPRCANKVSCANILALATRDVVSQVLHCMYFEPPCRHCRTPKTRCSRRRRPAAGRRPAARRASSARFRPGHAAAAAQAEWRPPGDSYDEADMYDHRVLVAYWHGSWQG